MNKKITSIIFIFIVILSALVPIFFNGKIDNNDSFVTNLSSNNMDNILPFDIQSKSAILLDFNSGKVIYSKNENDKHQIASMCKIMTLLLTFEEIENGNLNYEDEVIISNNAKSMGGSQVFLQENGKYKVKDLIKSIVVASANDASVAIAEKIAGTESNFVVKMNEKARELSMQNTNFVNSTGLPKVGQFSTAKDVSIMFSNLLKHKDYYNYSKIWIDKIIHPDNSITEISNTNKLIRFYKWCDSGKTGYTSEAGHCIACSSIKDNMRIVSVVISSKNSKERFKETTDMFNYAFSRFENKKVIEENQSLDFTVDIKGGKQNKTTVVAENSFLIFKEKNSKTQLDIEFIPLNDLVAPIKQGDIVGEIIILENGERIGSVNTICPTDINKINYFDSINLIIKNWQI